MIMQFSLSGMTMIPVSEEVKIIWIFAGDNRLTCTYDQCLHPAILSLPVRFYIMRINILCTSCFLGYTVIVLNFYVPWLLFSIGKLLRKSC